MSTYKVTSITETAELKSIQFQKVTEDQEAGTAAGPGPMRGSHGFSFSVSRGETDWNLYAVGQEYRIVPVTT